MKLTFESKAKWITVAQELPFAAIMGFIMVSIISLANIIARFGLQNDLLRQWVTSILIGFPISVPLLLILPKRVKKIISKFTNQGVEK
jgi:hypothetical protein